MKRSWWTNHSDPGHRFLLLDDPLTTSLSIRKCSLLSSSLLDAFFRHGEQSLRQASQFPIIVIIKNKGIANFLDFFF